MSASEKRCKVRYTTSAMQVALRSVLLASDANWQIHVSHRMRLVGDATPLLGGTRLHSVMRPDRICRNNTAATRETDADRDILSERLTPEHLVHLLRSRRDGESLQLCDAGLEKRPILYWFVKVPHDVHGIWIIMVP